MERFASWVLRVFGWRNEYPLWLNLMRFALAGGAWLFVVFIVGLIVFVSVQEATQ